MPGTGEYLQLLDGILLSYKRSINWRGEHVISGKETPGTAAVEYCGISAPSHCGAAAHHPSDAIGQQ